MSGGRAGRFCRGWALCLAVLGPWSGAGATGVGEEVEVSSAVVTALSCAQEAKKSGRLDALSECPPAEAAKGLVLYDVAERTIYRLEPGKVYQYELESAFGGGSIDFEGQVVRAEADIPVVKVAEYSVTPKKKPGAFKGCL